MAASKSREVYSSLFGFHEKVTICSYISVTQKKKPEIIHYYNKTKIGVDTMDQMLGRYTTKRQTNRWPPVFFYNIVDVAAYILYYENNKMIQKKDERTPVFLAPTQRRICMPSIEDRLKNPQIHYLNAAENIFGRPVNDTSTPSTSSGQRFDSTGRKIVVGSCHICNKGAFKKRRKTQKAHEKCKKEPVYNDNALY